MMGPPPTMLLPGAPPAPSQGPAPPGGPPGAPPGGEPFQSTLAEEWARTAPAEGHSNKGEEEHAGKATRHPSDGEQPPPGPVAHVVAAVPSHQARPAAKARPAGAPSGTAAGRSTQAGEQAPGGARSAAPQQGKAPAAGTVPAALAPAAGTAKPGGEKAGPDSAAAAPQAAGPEVRAALATEDSSGAASTESADAAPARDPQPLPGGARTPDTHTPPAQVVGGNSPVAGSAPARQQEAADRTPSTRTVASPDASAGVTPAAAQGPSHHGETQARTAASSPPASSGSQAGATSGASSQEAALPATAAPSSATAAAAAPSQGVPLQDMIDSIRGTIELSVRQGSTRARIALSPAELGDIRIHLAQTSDGLTARVTAGTAAAAQALAQGRPELQQALSSLGLSLLSLDIGLSGQGAAGHGSMQGDSRGRSAGSTGSEDDSAEAISESEQGPEGPAKGELVDVLA